MLCKEFKWWIFFPCRFIFSIFCNSFFIIYMTRPSLLIYLGSMLLCIISDKQLMEKMNWFCENWVPCKWNYWMTLHPLWFEFKFNWREMGYKLMYKILKIYLGLWRWEKKKTLKRHNFKKNTFSFFIIRKSTKQTPICNYHPKGQL
jgi:hypothetical protein